MAGTWSTIINPPPATVCTTFMLTDGTVLAQGVSTQKWYRLTPDPNGNYVSGTWTTMADSTNAPLYYASGILRDGRLIVAGGEYNFGALVWLNAAEIYNPVSNVWTSLATPAGWARIGDAPGCVLPDGRFIVGEVSTVRTAIYDPATNAWTAAANKISRVGEESWSLLPDGTIHAVDCSNPPNAEKYIVASDVWVPAGATPQTLVDSISEIGASVLLPDGRLFVIGATGFTALYTFPPIASQTGTWVSGPTIPQVNPGEALGAVDAPAAVLPNGRVLFSAGPITTPASFQAPTYYFEYDPITNSISAVPRASATNSNGFPYFGRMLVLPTGQVLYTHGTTTVEVYTPDSGFDPVWRPTITSCPATIRRGRTYTLSGRQINGLTQCVYYGNDATQATNYPIVRLEATFDSTVVYCRTFDFSTMGLQTGTVIHTCRFTVPSAMPLGCYRLVVIANGIPSEPFTVCVSPKVIKELKVEIKEKNEILELDKRLLDLQKRLPDITDVKAIREEFDVLGRHQEAWLETVRAWANQMDQSQQALARAFIRPDERPEMRGAEPEIEPIEPRRLSREEAERAQIKRAFNDNREELPFTKEADEFRRTVHSLSSRQEGRSRDDVNKTKAEQRRGSKPKRRR